MLPFLWASDPERRSNAYTDPNIAGREAQQMTFSVKDMCERYRVGEHTVLVWIHNGELAAIDVSRQSAGKPKWRITQDALTAFEISRTATPAPPRAGRRRKPPADIVEFY